MTAPSYKRRIALNTFFLSVADIINKFLMFFFYVLAARHLGVKKFGILSFGFAFSTMFSALTDLGLGAVAAREIARNRQRAKELIGNAIGIKLIVAFLVIILIWGMVNILGYPQENKVVVYICSLFVLETAFIAYFIYIFQGFQRMEFTALIRVIQSLILFGGVLILTRISPIPVYYAWLYAGAGLVTTIIGIFIITRNFVPLGVSFNCQQWRAMLLEGLPIGVASIFVLFYYWNGTTLLSKIAGDRSVGFYNAAFRLVIGLNFLGISFSSALYPVFSNLFTHNLQGLIVMFIKAIRWLIILLLPMGILGTVLAEPLIILIYGTGYQSAGVVLRILVWWAFAAGFTSLFSNYFMATNHAHLMTIQTATALLINIVLNLMMIPAIGVTGAAISIVAAEFASLIFYIAVWCKKNYNPSAFILLGGNLLRATAALIPAAVVAFFGRRLHVVVGLGAGVLCYLILLIVFREIRSNDIEILKPIFNKLR